MVGIMFNEDAKQLLPEFIVRYNPAFPVGFTKRDPMYAWMQLSMLKKVYVPIVAFVDKTGMFREQYSGADSFFQNPNASTRAALDRLIKFGAAPASARKASPKK